MATIKLETSCGTIKLQLNEEAAPITVENFLSYVRDSFYDGTIFHRVIDGFMIQGGGFTAEMEQKEASAPIENEADNGLSNDWGTIAMARTNDPHSATSQFFINVSDNDFLNHSEKSANGWGYAVFGELVEGRDVIDKIRGVTTTRKSGHDDVPEEPVVIESITEIPD